MESFECPVCGGEKTEDLGRLPTAIMFAGAALDRASRSSNLLRCAGCKTGFRFPRLRDADLADLYARGDGRCWAYSSATRPDWEIASSWIHELVPRLSPRVLDVGCSSGEFLARYGGDWDKYGIEPRPDAARASASRGIKLLESTLEDLKERERFDVVTAFDVVEHVLNPRAFIESCLSVLRADGLLIISSGNFDSYPMRLLQARHYYVAMPEHVSFLGDRHLDCLIAAGAKVIRAKRFSHDGDASLGSSIYQGLKAVVYGLSPQLFNMVRGIRRGPGNAAVSPPVWSHAQDHFIVAIGRS